MRATIASLVSNALLLTQQAAAAPTDTDTWNETTVDISGDSSADSFSVASISDWTYRRWNGANYACKCYPGDPCWPSTLQWNLLNATVGGNLQISIPPAASCYNTFQGLLGNISTYNAAQCADVHANYASEQWQIDLPTAGLWTYFTNDTCRPTTKPTDSCTGGYFPTIYIKAKTIAHIQAGILFAKNNNLRLIIRNTGHDFLGRSVGWGALVINTHGFKDISLTNSYRGACNYTGSAITVGAGVQAFEALSKLHSLSPPKIMVTGECATVGVAGGLVQGGGHGPLTNFYGFLADTALEFQVITADGALRTANAKTNPDLFWALRGGGPSAFGVIVQATYKTFDDYSSSGTTFALGPANVNNNDTLWWDAIAKFHSYSNHFVDNGLYIYYELYPGLSFRVQPVVGVNKTAAQLEAVLQPLFNDWTAMGLTFDKTTTNYSTFYELYNALFESEVAGDSALTGGWAFGKTDVAINNAGIIDAFKNVLNNGALLVGHMWNGGHGLPQSQWADSAINLRFRNVSDKLITILPLSGNAPLAEKEAAQRVLTDVVDGGLRAAGPNGAAYINEADPFQPNWQTAFWGTNYPKLLQLRQKWDPTGVFYSVSTPGTEKWEQIEYSTRLCKKL
ncbi:uncharacterized protein B0T23DRAFT_17731 [Neurospora hispaniola]|uniref:FAD-binding PCMH-type domain-containing protein n=1 Tax=Neurospora hispaniola TaxID=588809 RepID=A0AAJ0IFN9_9PEZI|nr:hypothetical protein B0T23DRAFT_17731 [Neurospora hispaniola]